MKKKTKNLVSCGIGVLFLVGVITLISVGGNGDGSNPDVYSASVLTILENNFDFNTISMKDGDVSHQFEVKNDGEEPVVIEKVYTSCMCTTVYITNSSGRRYGKFGMPGHGVSSKTNIEVKSGESVTVETIFDPKAHGPSGVGLVQRSVYIETNSAKLSQLELSFQAMVTK